MSTNEFSLEYRIEWRDNKTGATGVHVSPYGYYAEDDWPGGGPSLYWWEEGNGSCDCNRRIILLGEPYEDTECGDGRVDITKVEWREKGSEAWKAYP